MNLQSLTARLRRTLFARATVRADRRPAARLRVEPLEGRVVPATLPAPVVSPTSYRSIDNDGFAPTLVADPTNPLVLVTAFARYTNGVPGTQTAVTLRYSTNGGASWQSVPLSNGSDPNTGGAPYTNVGTPSLAFDRFQNVFVTYTEQNAAGQSTSGRVIVRKFSMAGALQQQDLDPFSGRNEKVLYQWVNSDEAYNPTVAVDTNLDSYQDPVVGGANGQQSDALVAGQKALVPGAGGVRVFVAWNTNTVLANGAYNPNAIRTAVSDDGGVNFAAPVILNSDTHFTSGRYAQPKMVFTPGRAGEANSGGKLVTVYDDFGLGRIRADTRQFTYTSPTNNNLPQSVEVTNNSVVGINDATTTDYVINIPASEVGPGKLTKIENMSLTLALEHNDIQELRAQLIAPDGTAIVLFVNRVDGNGNVVDGRGIDGKQLGVVNSQAVGTVFQDNAVREIYQGTAPRTGTYKATGGSLLNAFNALVANGTTDTISGNWTVRITDVRATQNNNDPKIIRSATLRLSQNYKDGMDADRTVVGAAPAAGTFAGTGYPTKPAYAPSSGAGPGLSVAVDNSLGAYSPYQNRIFIAYNAGGSIAVKYSDDGGLNWSPTGTTVGAGFLPQLAVDPVTGTLVVAYYSAQNDQAGVRSATMLATAVNQPLFKDDGPIQFSTPAYVNPSEQYLDQIRSKTLTFEPIPSNPLASVIGPEGYGNNVGLVAYGGKVNLLYAGNLNSFQTTNLSSVGTQIRTQDVTIAAGARVVSGDTGPVLAAAQTTPIDQVYNNVTGYTNRLTTGTTIYFNNQAAADGHLMFDGFVVELDRVVDPTTFTPADVTVRFFAPSTAPLQGTGEDISDQVLSVTRLDSYVDPLSGRDYGSKRFLVRLTPQDRVGSYGYAIGADISDRIRVQAVNYTSPDPTVSFNSTPYNQNTNPYGTPQPIGDPPNGNPAVSRITVPATVPGWTAGSVIGDVNVRLRVTHPDVSTLQVTLTSPSGLSIRLVNAGDAGQGADFGTAAQQVKFDSEAAVTLADDTPPYTSYAAYKPAEDLGQLFANDYSGAWTLTVVDTVPGQGVGTLESWGLDITPTVLANNVSLGNLRDQNQNAVAGEAVGPSGYSPDAFAVPTPANGVPFQLPYLTGSVPVTVTGPRLIDSRVPNQPATADNVVVNGTVSAIDVLFDRTMDASTFGAADVLRITTPVGDLPGQPGALPGVSVAPVSGLNGTALAAGTNSKAFRITFPTQQLAGTYRVQLGSQIADTVANSPADPDAPHRLDTNQNAGVAYMTGGAVGAPDVSRVYSAAGAAALPANATTTVNLTVADAYQITQAKATLSIAHPNVRDLEARLVAPDGTSVLLFVNTPVNQNVNANGMTNTTFADDVKNDNGVSISNPIQTGQSPFAGTYNPIEPLARLNGSGTRGTWKLVVQNKGSSAGSVTRFDIDLAGAQIGTGLGEAIADQTSVGFRVFPAGGTTAVGKANWTPTGPDGNGSAGTAGRVGAVAVDPTDLSGNTVYAAGASGGVWRTTNFLTRDPLGPVWVPLTDFGPSNAINVGALAVYPSADRDPAKTTILVGTGSESLNRIEQDEMNGAGKFRFDGLGFLLSEDAGKTWQILDSTNNYDPATKQYRPVVDPGPAVNVTSATESGTTATLTTDKPHGFQVGMRVTVSGVSVAGYNGTFTVTGTPSPTTFTYTAGQSGLANGSGGTARQADRRDHAFVGAVVNKLVFEPNRNPTTDPNDPGYGRLIVYAAVGQGSAPGGTAGLYRSMDGGRTWVKLGVQGSNGTEDASDFVLAEASVEDNTLKRTSTGYLALEGKGVYKVTDLNVEFPTFALMTGGFGRPTVKNGIGGPQVGVDPAIADPNGGKSRIVLATPQAVPGDPNANIYYKEWVYAAVSTAAGAFDGLYVTKDGGANWTKVNGDKVAPLVGAFRGGARSSLALALDPSDPNIVYVGSDTITRVDTTFLNDPYNLSLYQSNNATDPGGVGVVRNQTRGGAVVTATTAGNSGLLSFDPVNRVGSLDPGTLSDADVAARRRVKWNQLNLKYDPYQPFLRDTLIQVQNVNKFFNDGADVVLANPSVARVGGGPGEVAEAGADFDSLSQIVTYRDPLTGKGRVIYGSDEGIGSFVTDGSNSANGGLNEVVGFDQRGVNLTRPLANVGYYTPFNEAQEERNLQVEGSRNGDMQVARLYSGDPQPSMLAASASGLLYAAAARRTADALTSEADMLATGNVTWTDVGRSGRANYVMTDPSGGGNLYILRRIGDLLVSGDDPVNFIQVSRGGVLTSIATTNLFRPGSGDNTGTGQWDNTVRRLAVNPLDPLGILIGSKEGRVYRTTDLGATWQVVAEPTAPSSDLDGRYTSALAFGAKETASAAPNSVMYAGTEGGKVFVKTGSTTAPDWKDISAGLPGATIQKLVPNPKLGTHELYAVTDNGVFYMADWTAPAAAWADVTGTLLQIQKKAFVSTLNPNPAWTIPVLGGMDPTTGSGVGTPELLTIAVDWRPAQPPSGAPAKPILYVGGDGGVFRGLTNPATGQVGWERYTGTAQGATYDGGGLPAVKVTDLDLAVGKVRPTDGTIDPNGSADLLVATTLGRGTWTIGVGKPAGISGPYVVNTTPLAGEGAADPSQPQFTPPTSVVVQFNDVYMNPLKVSDVTIKGPSGETITPTSVDDITNPPTGQVNLHNRFRITFNPLTSEGVYTITIAGPVVNGKYQSPSDAGGTPINQDRDANNGEPGQDAFVFTLVVGTSDLSDFVNDTYRKLAGRGPTRAEYTATTVKGMETARYAGLGVVLKEVLAAYNSNATDEQNGYSEARQRLVTRLFSNGGATDEIGNLIPNYTPSTTDRDAFAKAIKDGLTSPELVMADIMATTDVTKPWYNIKNNTAPYYGFVDPMNPTPAEIDGFLSKVYADLFKGLGITLAMTPTVGGVSLASQRTQAKTPQGRYNLVKSLLNGNTVTYDHDQNTQTARKSITFRAHVVNLAYAKYLPGYTPTAAELSSAQSLMGSGLVKPSTSNPFPLQGSEWVVWKVMTSGSPAGKVYFERQTQNEGLPDDGLHTNRSWVDGVINDRLGRASTAGERDEFSGKVLATFPAQRKTFLQGFVNSTAYRDAQAAKYFAVVYGRPPTTAELSAARSSLAGGTSYQGLIANWMAATAYYNAPPATPGVTATNPPNRWAQTVYWRLLGRAPSGGEEGALATKATSYSGRQSGVLAILNGDEYRRRLITDTFQVLLGRNPTSGTPSSEMELYLAYLAKGARWQDLPVDMLGYGTAGLTTTSANWPPVTLNIPREFWEIVD